MHGQHGLEGALLGMIDLAYSAADDREMIHVVFEALRAVVPFSSGVFMPVRQATMELQAGFCLDCDMADMAQYLAYYALMDPFVRRAPGPMRLNQNLLLSEVISPGELDRSEFSDFLHKVPYCHAMGMLTGAAQRAVAAVSVHRQKRERDFTAEEKAVFERIGPHLARAVVLRALANDSLQRTATGIAVFASTGKLLYLNGPARGFLVRGEPPAILAALSAQCGGVLRIGAQTYRLSRLPWSAASLLRPFAEEDTALNSTEEAQGSTPPVASLWPERIQHPQSATIVVLRPFHARTDLVRRLAQYGLSPRQSEIATLALRGLINGEIARQINISEQTVRDHFQEIYSRIGVHSRTELLARVLGTNGATSPALRAR